MPAEVPAEAPEAPAAPAAERIRLKPKLNQEPAQQATAQAAAEVPPEPAPAAEAQAEAPAAPPAPEEGKIKLKIKIPGALAPAEAAPPPAPEGEAAPGQPAAVGAPPPFPVLLPPAAGSGVIRPSGAPRPGAPRPGPPGRRIPPSVQASTARRKKIIKLILVALGGLAMAAGIIGLAIVKFIDPPPPPPTRIPKARPVHVEVQPEVPATETPEADAAKVAPPTEQVTPRPSRVKPKSGTISTTVTTDLAPGVTVTTEAVQAEVEASQSFRTFVADAKISGVFQGTPPRAFINGRLIRVGETVDSSLSIRFESVDPKTKNIVFKDSTGATVSRRY